MSETNDVAPIESLVGRTVLSLSSGNKLGRVLGVDIDPVNGRVLGLTLKQVDGSSARLPYEAIHSFGRDAVMASSDEYAQAIDEQGELPGGRDAKDLFGTSVVMESGILLGEIVDVLVTLKPPPSVLYEVRKSMLDRLLGRTFFIPASVAYVLSEDAQRLLVPDITSEIATTEVNDVVGPTVDVHSFPTQGNLEDVEEETVLREPEEDATVLRRRGGDEDDTLIMR